MLRDVRLHINLTVNQNAVNMVWEFMSYSFEWEYSDVDLGVCNLIYLDMLDGRLANQVMVLLLKWF